MGGSFACYIGSRLSIPSFYGKLQIKSELFLVELNYPSWDSFFTSARLPETSPTSLSALFPVNFPSDQPCGLPCQIFGLTICIWDEFARLCRSLASFTAFIHPPRSRRSSHTKKTTLDWLDCKVERIRVKPRRTGPSRQTKPLATTSLLAVQATCTTYH